MRRKNHAHILFRYALMMLFILFLAACICVMLFQTTVVDADEWNKKAQMELSKVDTILPERGNIVSDKGYILATNLRYYNLRIDYRCARFKQNQFLASIDSLSDSLAAYFPIRDRKQWREHLEKPLKTNVNKRPRSWTLLKNVSYLDLQRVKAFPFFKIGNSNKTGLVVESVLRRSNPYGAMARRSIGGVGQTDVCPEIHGISGLEKALDTLLYGVPGLAKRIPLTKRIVSWTDVAPQRGYDVRTTINIELQDILENELNRMLDSCLAEWGCAILMDVKTGDIKAISNLELSKDGRGYIEARNYAVMGFEPGSVMKPISMLIALEDGAVNNIHEVIPIGASWAYAGGRPITDSHAYSSLTVSQIIEKSSNIGMARIIARKFDGNPKGFVDRLRSIGFFDPMNTGIAGETEPYFNPNPTRLDLSRMCYGYASQIPPIFTLSIYNAIANGGRYVRPRLVKGIVSETVDSIMPVTYIRDRICSEENAKKLQYMLTQVVESAGTGRRLRNDKVMLAGKTGTCYTVDTITKQYDTSKKRLAFCGFFPADNPQYSCMVLTYHPRRNMFGAASTSGQVMRNVALRMYSRGLLGNSSDYTQGATELSRAQLYGSITPGRHSKVRKAAGIKSEVHPAKPQPASEGMVPSVIGLGLREAVGLLEKNGYNVAFNGSGYVRRQSPAQGVKLAKGGEVTLELVP